VCSGIASLVAIMAELAAAKEIGSMSLQHVRLTGITVVLTRLFMQTMFALHYPRVLQLPIQE
jgi:uncharacterized membrane protein